jgi:hypothetical protein
LFIESYFSPVNNLIASSIFIVNFGSNLGIESYFEYLCKISPQIDAITGLSMSVDIYCTAETIILVTFFYFATLRILCKCLSAFFYKTGNLLTHSFNYIMLLTIWEAYYGFILLIAISTIYFLIFWSILFITL